MKFAIYPFPLLYLRLALWWLDLKLICGPDAFKKGRIAGFHNKSSLFNKLIEDVICTTFLKASRGPLSFASTRGTVVESDRK